MNLSKFDSYSFNKRLKIITNQGCYLMSRKGRNGRISLLSLGLFFVEVWYDQENANIKMIRSIENPTFLEPYLNEIQLLDLYASL